MATWTHLKEWLVEKNWPWLNRIDPVLVDAAGVVDGWLEEVAFEEAGRRAIIDKASMALVEDTPIPRLDPLDRCLLSLRLEFARAFVIAMSAAESEGEVPEFVRSLNTASSEEKLRWVLIDGWRQLGRFQWEGIGYWLTDWMSAAETAMIEKALKPSTRPGSRSGQGKRKKEPPG